MNIVRLAFTAALLAAILPATAGSAADPSDDAFAWDLFLALNAPAVPTRAGDGPVVWERWANTADVYRDDAADPGPWPASSFGETATPKRFESLAAEGFENARHIVAGRMVPVGDPPANARRLIEIRMNRLSFDYIRAAGLYSLDGQMQKVERREAIDFPLGAIEVKASWRPIDASERARYHSLPVRFANGRTRWFGLSALNIAAKRSPQWFWASFEHRDNASRRDGEGWRLASRDRFACGQDPADCNRVPAGIGLEAGVWKNYRLRGSMSQYVDDAGIPERLGNSELESGLQESASCMTCHARATLAVVGDKPERLDVLDTFELDESRRMRGDDHAPGAARRRRGFVGAPDPRWYEARSADGRIVGRFEPMDFVWSLARAKPRRTVTDTAVRGSP